METKFKFQAIKILVFQRSNNAEISEKACKKNKDQQEVQASIFFKSEVNTLTLTYIVTRSHIVSLILVIRLFDLLTPQAFGANNNKVVSSSVWLVDNLG